MKIKIASDLHLEFFNALEYLPDVGLGDVLILAGDIVCARHLNKNGYLRDVYLRFFDNCSKNFEKVLYVMGNHEFYGYNYKSAYNTIKENIPSNFYLMENDTVTIGDWNFIGFTFWTNFRNANPIEMLNAEMYMNDYKVIRVDSNYRKLRAQDTLGFHRASIDYLFSQLNEYDKNVFVISHHAPSYQSISEEFKNANCNDSFCSQYDNLILNYNQIKYWVHGHVHSPFDYKIGDCRVICNPLGYRHDSITYDPSLYLKI